MIELSPIVACICEGGAETAIIDMLVDNELLKFSREQMLNEEVIRCRGGKEFEQRYLRKSFESKITGICSRVFFRYQFVDKFNS